MQNWHNPVSTDLFSLSRFRFNAVIDWMRFSVTLQNPSQFRHVQDRMLEVWGKVHFKPDQGTASSLSFTFRLNDPPGPDQFMNDLQSMVRPGDAPIREQDVVITGIEISLDAYIQGSDRQVLAQAVTYLIRHQANPPAGPPRITARGQTPLEPASIQDLLGALVQGGCTVNSGVKGSNWTCRYYLKDYDTVNGVRYAPLPPEQWRARFENTLQGPAAPFATVDGWRKCRFEKVVADRFALVVPDPSRSPFVASLQDYLVQLGRRPDSPKRRPSDRSQRRPYTRRDSVMNDKIRQALRALTRTQSCQNSVTDPDQTQVTSLANDVLPGQPPEYCIGSSETTNHQSLSDQHLRNVPWDKSLLTQARPICQEVRQATHTDTGMRNVSRVNQAVNLPPRFARAFLPLLHPP